MDRPQTWVNKCAIGERRVDFVELEELAEVYGKALNWLATKGVGRQIAPLWRQFRTDRKLELPHRHLYVRFPE